MSAEVESDDTPFGGPPNEHQLNRQAEARARLAVHQPGRAALRRLIPEGQRHAILCSWLHPKAGLSGPGWPEHWVNYVNSEGETAGMDQPLTQTDEGWEASYGVFVNEDDPEPTYTTVVHETLADALQRCAEWLVQYFDPECPTKLPTRAQLPEETGGVSVPSAAVSWPQMPYDVLDTLLVPAQELDIHASRALFRSAPPSGWGREPHEGFLDYRRTDSGWADMSDTDRYRTMEPQERAPLPYGQERKYDDPVAVRPACSCGWRGQERALPPRPQVDGKPITSDFQKQDAVSYRLDFEWGWDKHEVTDACWLEWSHQHYAQHEHPTPGGRTVSDAVNEITDSLDSDAIRWCVEQARKWAGIDPDGQASDHEVLCAYVRRRGGSALRHKVYLAGPHCTAPAGRLNRLRAAQKREQIEREFSAVVDEITGGLTPAQLAWCVEQAHLKHYHDHDATDRQVLATIVQIYGPEALRHDAENAQRARPALSPPTPRPAQRRRWRIALPWRRRAGLPRAAAAADLEQVDRG